MTTNDLAETQAEFGLTTLPETPPEAPPEASAAKDGPEAPEPAEPAQAAISEAADPAPAPVLPRNHRWHPDDHPARLPPAARPCRQGN